LKSPHYLILWLIPIYILLTHEIVQQWKLRPRLSWQLQSGKIALSLLLLTSAGIGDIWGFEARFTHIPGDALMQADAYINETLPPDAIVLTQNYIGVDITPSFLDITLINTPQLILQKSVTYIALYWSKTEPIPATLGPVNQYCMPMQTFTGFKDFVEVCKINPIALAIIANAPTHPTPTKPPLQKL
jgi:hypothetical protein